MSLLPLDPLFRFPGPGQDGVGAVRSTAGLCSAGRPRGRAAWLLFSSGCHEFQRLEPQKWPDINPRPDAKRVPK